MNNPDYEAFLAEYKTEEQEILVLFSNASGGAAKTYGDLWLSSAYFLAYFDLQTGQLKEGDGRIAWAVSSDDLKEKGLDYPYNFKGGKVYRLRVRDLIDRTVPEGRLPSFYNRFAVTEVLEEDAENNMLANVWQEYIREITIHDDILGDFTLDKDHSTFDGAIMWCGEEISVYMDVDKNDETTWHRVMENLRTLCANIEETDRQFRAFAAERMTELANDWREEDTPEITRESFAERISLESLAVDVEEYSAYYSDDDIFFGHAVTVSGDMKNGMKSVTIEG